MVGSEVGVSDLQKATSSYLLKVSSYHFSEIDRIDFNDWITYTYLHMNSDFDNILIIWWSRSHTVTNKWWPLSTSHSSKIPKSNVPQVQSPLGCASTPIARPLFSVPIIIVSIVLVSMTAAELQSLAGWLLTSIYKEIATKTCFTKLYRLITSSSISSKGRKKNFLDNIISRILLLNRREP